MRTLLPFLFLLASLLGVGKDAAAQCAPIAGTGCPGATAPICGTQPIIGTNFIFRCQPACFPTPASFVIIGTPLPPVALPSPPLCVPGCMLGCQPLLVVAAPGATLAIPNNPALIGFVLCIQCLCQTSAGCFNLGQAISATIM